VASKQAPTQYSEVFVPEYYILKKSNSSDYKHLERLSSSANPTTAASAGLVLGYYYLKDGKLDEASSRIVQNYSDPALTEYMRNMGLLWLMELSLQTGDTDGAMAIAEEVRLSSESEAGNSALDMYCITTRIYPPSGADNYFCVEERLANLAASPSGEDVIIATQEPPQEIFKGVLDILVLSRAAPQDASGGVYYYLKHKMINHKIRMSKEYVEGDWDFIIDLDNEHLSARGGRGLSFKPDLMEPATALEAAARLQYCGKVLLGIGTGAVEAADALHVSLVEKGVAVGTVRIDDIVAARELRTFLGEWEKERFCAVGIGSEDDINNFVPTVRQYILMPDKQRVIVMESVDTGKNYATGYAAYYQGTTIFPIIELTFSDTMRNFAAEYENFSGRPITYETVLGYDMMHYIHSQTEEGLEDIAPYLTNITAIADNKTTRALKGFYIDSQNKIEQLILDIPVAEEEEEGE
jgi:hypothetical protein